MLQTGTYPEDLVITGKRVWVRSLEEAFSHADLDWREYVEIDPKYFRAHGSGLFIGNPGKARRSLGKKILGQASGNWCA